MRILAIAIAIAIALMWWESRSQVTPGPLFAAALAVLVVAGVYLGWELYSATTVPDDEETD